MKSLNQKTKIDLPNIKKRQVHKNKQTDYFDLLFDDKSNVELPFSKDIKHKEIFLNVYYLYLAIGLALLISACFLVVQIIVNDPKVEKLKAVAQKIEDISVEDDSKMPIDTLKENVPEVQFEDDVRQSVKKPIYIAKQPKQIINKKIEVSRKVKQKIITKPSNIIAKKSPSIIKPKSQSVAVKKTETKVQEAISEIMLRPLAVSSDASLRGLSKGN